MGKRRSYRLKKTDEEKFLPVTLGEAIGLIKEFGDARNRRAIIRSLRDSSEIRMVVFQPTAVGNGSLRWGIKNSRRHPPGQVLVRNASKFILSKKKIAA